jgi:acetoacetyl-CoA synthetase
LKGISVTNGVGVLTNSIEAVVVMLACASIGAIFSSTSPEMGAHGLIDRYSQSEPKILFLESTVIYGGAKRDLRAKLELRDKVLLLQRVAVLGSKWNDEVL